MDCRIPVGTIRWVLARRLVTMVICPGDLPGESGWIGGGSSRDVQMRLYPLAEPLTRLPLCLDLGAQLVEQRCHCRTRATCDTYESGLQLSDGETGNCGHESPPAHSPSKASGPVDNLGHVETVSSLHCAPRVLALRSTTMTPEPLEGLPKRTTRSPTPP